MMGAGRKTQTKTVPERTQPSSSINGSVSARNIPNSELHGVIFGCTHATIGECFKKKLFGLPEGHYSYIRKIVPGIRLFLFNFSNRKLHGIFEATSCGRLNIDPCAWTEYGSDPTPFPAQVRFQIGEKCEPLVEDQFKQIIANNYCDDKHFWFELDKEQTAMLVSLFSSLSDKPSTSTARIEVLRNANQPHASWNGVDLPPAELGKNLADNEQALKDEFDFAQVEVQGERVDAPLSNRHEQKAAQSNSKQFYSSATSGIDSSHSQKSWTDLFKDDAPSGKARESKNSDHNLMVDDSLISSGTSDTSLCFDTPREHLDDVKEKKIPEEKYFGCHSESASLDDVKEKKILEEKILDDVKEHESSPGVMASVDASLGDNQVPACGPTEAEMKHLGLLNTVAKLSQDLELMKSLHLMQSDKIRSLEQKLDISECKVEKVEEWLLKLQSTFMPEEDENDSILESNNDIHPVLDELIVIAGGFDESQWLSSVISYSPSKDSMAYLSDMSGPRSYASGVNLNGEFCIIGGAYDRYRWYNTVESYNPVNKLWTNLPSLKREKGCLAAISLDGKIFTVGGGNRQEYLSEVEMLDPNVGRWIPTTSMSDKRFATAAAEINGVLYVVGGYDGNYCLKSTERFDPRDHSWTRIADMNTKRAWHNLVVLNEKLYAFGGHDGDSILSSVEVFDPRVGSWTMGNPMNIPRIKFGSAAIGNTIYVFGGMSDGHRKVDTVEFFRSDRGWLDTGRKGFGERTAFSAVVM